MRPPSSFALTLPLAPLLAILLLPTAGAAPVGDVAAAPAIYQQRQRDGSVLLTDRPAAGAVIQRSWRVEPPDAGAAERREAARQDAAEVSRRIGQRLDADDRRAQELTIARLRAAAETQARLDADAAAAESQGGWIVGPRIGALNRRHGWNAVGTPPSPPPAPWVNGRPPTASIVRGIPLRADGFPVR